MTIPKPGAQAELDFRGERVKALVDAIEPDPETPETFLVTLLVGRDFNVGDDLSWVGAHDSRVPTSITHVTRRDHHVVITCRATSDSESVAD